MHSKTTQDRPAPTLRRPEDAGPSDLLLAEATLPAVEALRYRQRFEDAKRNEESFELNRRLQMWRDLAERKAGVLRKMFFALHNGSSRDYRGTAFDPSTN